MALTAVLLGTLLAGCTASVGGYGEGTSDVPVPTVGAAPPSSSSGRPTFTIPPPVPGPPQAEVPPADPPVAAAPVDPAAPAAPAAPADRPELAADVLADECLLEPSDVQMLIGQAVAPPRQEQGERGAQCVFATGAGAVGSGTDVLTIDVYQPREGVPADAVQGDEPGRRSLRGLGEAAAVVDNAPGAVLQVAGEEYLVTIAVLTTVPTDAGWRIVGRSALAALPG